MSNYPSFLGEEASVAQDLRGASPAAARRLVALTDDAALTRSLEELTATGIDVSVVSNAEALCDELLQSNSTVALVDSTTLQDPLEGLIDALATQFPDLRLLVAGHGAVQTQLATRIARGRVFRFVHKPASAQRLKLFVDAASRPAEPQRVSMTQTVEVLVDPQLAPARPERSRFTDGRRSPPLLAISIIAPIVIALGLYLLWPDGEPPAVDAESVAAGGTQATGPIGDLVRRADQAFAAGRYVAADGSSAAELYRDALKLDANDASARAGFDRSIDFGVRNAEQALLAERIDEAAGAVETLRLLAPANSRLAFLQSQIDKERARANQDAAQRQAFEARQVQIRASLGQMEARLARGALLDPARDNALLHFRAAEELGPGDGVVRNARDTLIAALLNAADARLESADAAGATRLIDAAASVNSSAPGLDPLRRRLEQLRSEAAAAPAPQPQDSAPATVAPEPPAPAALEPQAPTVVSAASLRRVRSADPVYPQRALAQLVSGWVDLEFTVATDGSVQDIVVVAAEPAGTFDAAAIAAVRRWRYAPVVFNGAPVEQRARQRVRFNARDKEPSRQGSR